MEKLCKTLQRYRLYDNKTTCFTFRKIGCLTLKCNILRWNVYEFGDKFLYKSAIFGKTDTKITKNLLYLH